MIFYPFSEKVNHKGTPILCDFCEFVCEKIDEIILHHEKEHRGEKRPNFKHLEKSETHLKQDCKSTRVDVLQKKTKNTHSYEKSAPAEIPLPSKKKRIELKCDYCPENFNTDSLFKTHYKTNHPNRPIIAPGDSA